MVFGQEQICGGLAGSKTMVASGGSNWWRNREVERKWSSKKNVKIDIEDIM